MDFETAEELQDLLDDGRVEDGVALLDDLLLESSGDATLHAARALLLLDLGRRTEAADAAARGTALDPEHPFAHFARGEVALGRGEVREAIDSALIAQRLAPDYDEAALLEARARTRIGHWDRVGAICEAILARNPEHEGAAFLLTIAQESRNQGPLSPERWNALAERFPLNAWARAGRAWTRLQGDDPGAAEAEFRQALTIDPSLAWARQGLVIALKARNPVYRLLLRWFIYLHRIPRRTRNFLAIGGVLGYNFVRRLAAQSPELKPVLVPLLVAYVAFVVLSWLADPLLNLLLMARKDSRRYLDRDDRMSGTLVGACLAAAVLLGLAGAFTGWEGAFLSALGIGFTSFTVSAAFHEAEGPRRTRFLGMAVLAAVLSLWAGVAGAELAGLFLLGAILTIAASTWMSRFGPEG